MQRKLSNNMKLLKALGNGPKTQAELMRETKVKNTYQIVADLKLRKACVHGYRNGYGDICSNPTRTCIDKYRAGE
jgi:hypothetical protein